MAKFLKDINLKGKIAVVTGATKGIGRSTAIAMHQVGATIVAFGRNKNDLTSLKKKLKIRIKCIECDVNDYKKISEIIKNLNRIDILVNNAGTNLPEPFLKVKKSSLEMLLNVNTKAAFNVAKLCTDKMLKLKIRKKVGGAIINTSSMFGLVAGPDRTVYSMTKFGIEGLTKGMAVDLAKYNIRVNSVCPNIVLTPRTKKYFADKIYNKYIKENTPLNKVVTVSDVATSIVFLASEASSMITGTSLIIDGGWTAK